MLQVPWLLHIVEGLLDVETEQVVVVVVVVSRESGRGRCAREQRVDQKWREIQLGSPANGGVERKQLKTMVRTSLNWLGGDLQEYWVYRGRISCP